MRNAWPIVILAVALAALVGIAINTVQLRSMSKSLHPGTQEVEVMGGVVQTLTGTVTCPDGHNETVNTTYDTTETDYEEAKRIHKHALENACD